MKKVIVYTTQFCGFCVAAKRLLASLEVPFEEISLDHDHQLRMKLSQENGGYRTVPMIFIGEDFIGGFDELNQLHRNGTLNDRLNA